MGYGVQACHAETRRSAATDVDRGVSVDHTVEQDMDSDLANIFEALLDMDTAEQAAALERRCAGNPELKNKVERLLYNDREMNAQWADSRAVSPRAISGAWTTATTRDISSPTGGSRRELDGSGSVDREDRDPAVPDAVAAVIHRPLEMDRERRPPDDVSPVVAATGARLSARGVLVAGTMNLVLALSLLLSFTTLGTGPTADPVQTALAGLPPLAVELDTVEAIRMVAGRDQIALLYQALDDRPPLSIEAARVLRDLGVLEAAPRIRAVLDRHGGRSRVELAACLVEMGDDDARDIARRSLDDVQHIRLVAAAALARAGHGDDRPADVAAVLREIFAQPGHIGRRDWRLAASGLLALGDADARTALRQELAHGEIERAVAAAEILARANDPVGLQALRRRADDPGSPGRGRAALLLATLAQETRQSPGPGPGKSGDKSGEKSGDDAGDPASALEFIAEGSTSQDPRDRRLAAAIAGRLARRGGARFAETLVALATGDEDRRVRITAQIALHAIHSAIQRES